MSEKGIKITLHFENEEDLKRDLFLSSTARIMIPEIELETSTGTLGGTYTTVEGILEKVHHFLSLKFSNII